MKTAKSVLRSRKQLQKKLHMKQTTQVGSMLDRVTQAKAKKLMTGNTVTAVAAQGLI